MPLLSIDSTRFERLIAISLLAILVVAVPIRVFAQTKVTLSQESAATPSVTVFNGSVFLSWTGTDSNHSINIAKASDGLHFGSPVQYGTNSSFTGSSGTSLTVFNGYVWLAWTGWYNYINIANSSDGLNFGNKTVYSEFLSYTTPAIGVQGSQFWLSYAYLNSYGSSNHNWTTAYSTDGVNFSGPSYADCASLVDSASGLVDSPTYSNSPFGSNPSALWFAATISGCNSPYSNYVTSFQVGGSEQGINIQAPSGATSSSGVGVTSLGSNVYLAWVPYGSNIIYLNTYQLQTNNSWTLQSSSSTGQSAVGNPVLLTFNGHIFMYWAGTDSAHHLNAEELL